MKCRTLEKYSLPFNVSLPCTYISQYKAGKKINSPLPLWIYKRPGTSLKNIGKKMWGKINLSNVNKHRYITKKIQKKTKKQLQRTFLKKKQD